MSEYFTKRGEKSLRSIQINRNALPGGHITEGYSNYVKDVFNKEKNSFLLNKNFNSSITSLNNQPKKGVDFESLITKKKYYASSTPTADALNFDGFGTVGEGKPKQISAVTMLRIENQFGKEALEDAYDDVVLKTSLDSIYEELGIDKMIGMSSRQKSSEYAVYKPKSFNFDSPNQQKLYKSYEKSYRPQCNQQVENEWKKKNRQILVDYKQFDSSPLSPYLFQNHPYVQRQDTRIIGSNFVQLTTRPRDRFLDKIDETLAMVRSMPRY